jgi:hypothetical protein
MRLNVTQRPYRSEQIGDLWFILDRNGDNALRHDDGVPVYFESAKELLEFLQAIAF